MKKKLSLLLAGAMVVSMLPMTAFAKTDNSITRVVTVKDDGAINDVDLVIEEKSANSPWDEVDGERFQLTLENGVWIDDVADTVGTGTGRPGSATDYVSGFTYVVVDDSSIIVTVKGTANEKDVIAIPMLAEADGEGDVKVTIDPLSSQVTGGTYTIANATSGATKTTIGDVIDATEGPKNTIKNLVITEVAPGSLKTTSPIKLKLSGEFEYVQNAPTVTVVDGDLTTARTLRWVDTDTWELDITGTSTKASKIVISGIKLATTDDVEADDVAEITVSGAGATRETLEVAKFVDYGYTWTAEDKDLPIVYSGHFVDADDTLEVTFKETVANSWLEDRKTQITVPDGIKIVDATYSNEKNVTNLQLDVADDGSKVTVTADATSATAKVEFDVTFDVSIEAGYAGPVDVTVEGSGVSNQPMTATIATAEVPVKVDTQINEVKIDYRNVPIADIVVTEAYPGAIEKGTTIRLEAEQMQFEKGIEYEVTAGDIKVDDVTVDEKAGTIDITIDSESAKEASSITLSNIQLYLNRSLPTGDYDLLFVAMEANDHGASDDENSKVDGFFRNWIDKDDDTKLFDTDEVVAYDNFVKVITAGRDQDDSLFTTKVSVTIGALELQAGEKTIALDVPAYISDAGYTMLPVRAVTEALSDQAIVSWDDATRKVTIIFGSRIISMTVGSNTMTINGTPVAMSAAVEITGDRAFIPLRDLGIALGVNESKIAWDDATKTATLN